MFVPRVYSLEINIAFPVCLRGVGVAVGYETVVGFLGAV